MPVSQSVNQAKSSRNSDLDVLVNQLPESISRPFPGAHLLEIVGVSKTSLSHISTRFPCLRGTFADRKRERANLQQKARFSHVKSCRLGCFLSVII